MWIQNNGRWDIVENFHGNRYQWAEFAFSDTNSSSWMVLCWVTRGGGATVHCGRGTNVEPKSPESSPEFFNVHPGYHGVTSAF